MSPHLSGFTQHHNFNIYSVVTNKLFFTNQIKYIFQNYKDQFVGFFLNRVVLTIIFRDYPRRLTYHNYTQIWLKDNSKKQICRLVRDVGCLCTLCTIQVNVLCCACWLKIRQRTVQPDYCQQELLLSLSENAFFTNVIVDEANVAKIERLAAEGGHVVRKWRHVPATWGSIYLITCGCRAEAPVCMSKCQTGRKRPTVHENCWPECIQFRVGNFSSARPYNPQPINA